MIDFNSEITERHLGLLWGKKNYKLPFQRSPQSLSTTKRGILSIVTSIFVLLGIVTPAVLKMKLSLYGN